MPPIDDLIQNEYESGNAFAVPNCRSAMSWPSICCCISKTKAAGSGGDVVIAVGENVTLASKGVSDKPALVAACCAVGRPALLPPLFQTACQRSMTMIGAPVDRIVTAAPSFRPSTDVSPFWRMFGPGTGTPWICASAILESESSQIVSRMRGIFIATLLGCRLAA